MRILHTMLRVGDLERSLRFYCDVLGMRLLARHDYPQGRFTLAFVGYEDGPVESPAGARTTLLELTHNWDTPAYELGNAYGHVAIGVPRWCARPARWRGAAR
jgi:lactoylglutathione lyase